MTEPFPKRGVAVSFLKDFIALHGDRGSFQDLTTTQVCNEILKPAMAVNQTSYCEYMEAQNHPKVGIATVFISHAWSFKFLDVVNALEYYFRNSMDTIVWFDLFSNNQHKAVDLNFDWWCNTFRSAIQDFGSTLMILAPYDNPIPLTRGWCIFELYCTFITHSNFQVAMCENDSLEFFKALEKDVAGTIDKMLAKIDARNSHCFKSEDKERIFEAIERTVGFNEINKMVFERLRDWVVSAMMVELDRRRAKFSQQLLPEEDVMVYVNILAGLYRHQGDYASALPLQQECLAKRTILLNADHRDTLMSLHNLATLYCCKGDYASALPLYQECLAKQKIHLGVDHPDTLKSMGNLARLYASQGDHASALPLYQECLAKRKIHLGVDHRDTLRSMNNLADLYNSQGDYASALPLYEECLAKRKTHLGVNHRDTLASMNNLAVYYDRQGDHASALPLYQECLAKRTIHLGVDHRDTSRSMNNLADLYNNQGDYASALPLYQECLAKYKIHLGVDHPDTLTSMHNLASLYCCKGDYASALPLYEECLARRKIHLGVDHSDTLKSMGNLADLYVTVASRVSSET